MAKLTYKGIDAPNWNITGGLVLANTALGDALKGFSDSLGNFREADQANADAILRERMLGLKTEDDFYKALQSGSLLDGISGRITAKAAENAWRDRNDLLAQDKSRFQYNNDTALAGASDLQSAIEIAATNGDRRTYNQIINSQEFRALPVQAQQKLLEDFDQIELNKAKTANLGRTDRIDNESTTLAELFSEAERKNNPEGSIEMSQKNHDDTLAIGKARGFSNASLQKFRNLTPSLTKTGFDGRTGGNVLANDASEILDKVSEATGDIVPGKYVITKSNGQQELADIDKSVQSSVNANNAFKRTLSQETGIPEATIEAYTKASNGNLDINEIASTVSKSFGLDSEDAMDYANKLYSLTATGELSPRAARAIAQIVPPEDTLFEGVQPNSDGVQRFINFESNRGSNEIISTYNEVNKATERINQAAQSLESATNELVKAKNDFSAAPTQANKKKLDQAKNKVDKSNKIFRTLTIQFDNDREKKLEDARASFFNGTLQKQREEQQKKKQRIQEEQQKKKQRAQEQLNRVLKEGNQ